MLSDILTTEADIQACIHASHIEWDNAFLIYSKVQHRYRMLMINVSRCIAHWKVKGAQECILGSG